MRMNLLPRRFHSKHARLAALGVALPVILVILLTAASCGSRNTTATSTLPTDGSSFEDAIKVGSIGEERDILNKYACGSGGHYRNIHVATAEKDGRHYDIIDAECTAGPERRQFYFDVSSCFPCNN